VFLGGGVFWHRTSSPPDIGTLTKSWFNTSQQVRLEQESNVDIVSPRVSDVGDKLGIREGSIPQTQILTPLDAFVNR